METKQLEQLTGYARNMTNDVKIRAEQTGTITFIASTRAPDRHGSVLSQENWQLANFRRNPIIGYQHNLYGDSMCNAPDPDDVIGKGMNERIENGQLVLDITFDIAKDENGVPLNKIATKIHRKVMDGFLNMVSVGFLPILNEFGDESRKGDESRGEDPNLDFMFGQELLEVSVVNIPSNPEAGKRQYRNQTATALKGLQRMLGLSFDTIRDMKVTDILEALELKTLPRSVNTTGDEKFKYVETLDTEHERELEEYIKDIDELTMSLEEAEVKTKEVSEDAELSLKKARKQIDLFKIRINGHN